MEIDILTLVFLILNIAAWAIVVIFLYKIYKHVKK
jgi:hypothetical protein